MNISLIVVFTLGCCHVANAGNDFYMNWWNAFRTEAIEQSNFGLVPQRTLSIEEIKGFSNPIEIRYLRFSCLPSEREKIFQTLVVMVTSKPSDEIHPVLGLRKWSRDGAVQQLQCFADDPRVLEVVKATSSEDNACGFYSTRLLGLSAQLQGKDEEIVDQVAGALDRFSNSLFQEESPKLVAGLRSQRAVDALKAHAIDSLNSLSSNPRSLLIGDTQLFTKEVGMCARFIDALASMEEPAAKSAAPELVARFQLIYGRDAGWEHLINSFPDLLRVYRLLPTAGASSQGSGLSVSKSPTTVLPLNETESHGFLAGIGKEIVFAIVFGVAALFCALQILRKRAPR